MFFENLYDDEKNHIKEDVEQEQEINQNDYYNLFNIGKGAYSKVFKCNSLKTGEIYVIKKIKNDRKFDNSALKEINILKNILTEKSKNNIIEFYGSYTRHNQFNLVLEYFGINLYQIYKINKVLTLELYNDYNIILKNILIGLKYLHKNNIIHGDLKPENILYDGRKKQIRIIDFGCAIFNNKEKNNFYVQSRFYRAPEVMFTIDYNNSIDIWSFGCISYELFIRKPLFIGHNEMIIISNIIDILGCPKEDYYLNSFGRDKYLGKYSIEQTYNILENHLLLKFNNALPFINKDRIKNLSELIQKTIVYNINRPSAEDLLKYKLFE